MKISHGVIRADSKDAHIRTNKNKQDRCSIYSVSDEVDDLEHPYQEHDSAATSINSTKLPAIYRMINLQPGTVGIDFGGGKFDNAVEYLRDKDVTLCVYDPYNRSVEHNKEVLRTLRANGGADFAINSNVLNVIKEPSARRSVLENIKKITKIGAPIYITVYEGRGDGKEGATKSGYQLNRKTADYLEEIQEVFPDAKRKGKLIVATNSGSVNSSVDIKSSSQSNLAFMCPCCHNNTVYSTEKDIHNIFDVDYEELFICDECGSELLAVPQYDGTIQFKILDNDEEINSSTSVEARSYGGAYDVDPEQYFTKDDIIEFGNYVCESLDETFNDTYDIADVYMKTPKKLYLAIVQNSDGSEFECNVDIDMRKIRKPADIIREYGNDVVYSLRQQIESYNEVIESSYDVTGSTALKRIARYGEFDNGRVFHNWTKMTDEQAEELAKQMSLENPDDVYYVEYDDLMDSCSDTRWINGQPYSFENVGIRGGKPYIKNADVKSPQSYLDRIDELMEQGLDEETASREAYAEFYPDEYDADDYDEIYSANYGGAYDVDPEQYFTREDLVEFAEDVVDRLNAISYSKFDYTEVYFGPGNDLELTVAWSDYEDTIKEHIDMRKIRKPSDLCKVYAPPFVNRAREVFSEYGADFGPHYGDYEIYSSKSPNSVANKYPEYMKVSRGGQDFSVHYNLIDNSPSADAHKMWLEFQASVSAIKPYDDAEYAWAQIENGHINVIKGGKVIQQYYYFDADDMDVENSEWCDSIIEQAIDYISEINDKVESRMVHNSTDTSDNSITGAVYGPDSPDDDDEGNELDPQTVNIQMHLDADIQLTEESWNYVDTTYPWAASSDEAHKGAWYTTIKDTEVYLGDRVDMVQYTDELLATLLPDVPGTYHIAGDVDLTFIISGLVEFNNEYDDSTYIETDWADVEFDIGNSSISNFKIDKK